MAVIEQRLLCHADTLGAQAVITAPWPAFGPRPLPFRRPCPSQAPYLALPPSSPHLLPHCPSLACSVPKDQNPGRVHLSCDSLGQRAGAQAVGSLHLPLAQSSPKALGACLPLPQCPLHQILGVTLATSAQYPSLPALPTPVPREPPGTGQRAAPGISLFLTAVCKLLLLSRAPVPSSSIRSPAPETGSK